MPVTTRQAAKLRRYWDKHAHRYDRQMQFWERRLFGDTRAWVCQQATGEVLEVAIGTGLNLDFYPEGVRLTGVDFSPAEYLPAAGFEIERQERFKLGIVERLAARKPATNAAG